MISYVFDIGERARKVGRFLSSVRAELQNAAMEEKKARKLTQQDIASALGVHRSVINRQLTGEENLTLSRVAELAWVLGRDVHLTLDKPLGDLSNEYPITPPSTSEGLPQQPLGGAPTPSTSAEWSKEDDHDINYRLEMV
jgi:transcriptional regulator with XRE-family HTH domain